MAICNDPPEQRDALVEKLGLTFPVVSDTDLALTAAFGLRQEGKDSPLPGSWVLDRQGLVAWRAVGDNIVVRPTVADLLERVRAAGSGTPPK